MYTKGQQLFAETDGNKQFAAAAACDIWEEVHNCIRVYAEILVKAIKFVVYVCLDGWVQQQQQQQQEQQQ